MIRSLPAFLLAAALAAPAKGRPAMAATAPPLIPAPEVWEPAAGGLPVDDVARLLVGVDDGGAARQAALLAAWWRDAAGRTLPVQTAGPGAPAPGSVTLAVTRGGPDTAPAVPGAGDERWELRVGPEGVAVTAATPVGLFRGLAALRQLVLLAGPDGALPAGRLAGGPRFRWRGLLLDSGRHPQDVALIKRVIDHLALYGFNVLHWHLTEDQGWRLDVPARPALTQVGAWRAAPGGGREGGFYTAAEVREVVAHAAERFVTVVPEIEVPGHAVAALAAYPELSCTGGPFAVQTLWGIHADVFCAGNDAVFDLLADVFDEVVRLFPARYVHVGGDEVPTDRWRACPRCRRRVEEEGLDGPHRLQAWFMERVARLLRARDRRLVGWDEILAGGLPPGATVQSWRGTRGAVAAARAGHDAIVSPTSHAYLDYDPRELPLEKVLAFAPVPAELEDALAGRILGGEMNLWTEYVPPERVLRRLFPRAAAMAEVLGGPPGPRDFGAFLPRLRAHEAFWPRLGIAAGPASRPLALRLQARDDGDRPRAELRDGTADLLGDVAREVRLGWLPLPADWRPDVPPEEQLAGAVPRPLAGGFLPDGDVLAVARLHVDGAPYGAPAVLERQANLARGRSVALARPPSPRYRGRGSRPLTDGARGGRRFDDGCWTGFEAVDLEASLDLGRETAVAEVSLRAIQDANAWVFLPRRVVWEGSRDGVRWFALGEADHDVPDTEQRKVVRTFAVAVDRPLRHVRVRAANVGVCPDWHPGRGEAAWLFVDEILVR